MTATTDRTRTPYTDEGFRAFLVERDHEPSWLQERRRQAWQVFQQLPWPNRRGEEWSRTDLRLFRLDDYGLPAPASVPAADSTPALLSEGVSLAGAIRSVDGSVVSRSLAAEYQDRGVRLDSISNLATSEPGLIQDALARSPVPTDYDRFSALSSAAFGAGALLYVPRGVVIDRPVHLMAILTEAMTDLSRLVLIMEDDSEATFLTELASAAPTGRGFHCGAIELHLARGARARFVSLQNWGSGVWHFSHQTAILQRDASLQWTIGALGSRLAKVNQHVILAGAGAESQVNGVMFTEGKQHLAYHTLQHHQQPHGKSDLLYKAALQDQSRTVWRGMIKVDPGAQKTDGYQRNDNLILSRLARADSIPGLEIEADDVRCTHGSTSGHVDDELIFYAQSRGFTRQEAIRMIVSGFFQQVFDRITITSVRDALSHAIARRVREYD